MENKKLKEKYEMPKIQKFPRSGEKGKIAEMWIEQN